MIKIENISKNYNNVKALKKVSFNVKDGQLFGLIGPDGAGKTSLFRILTTLLITSEGKASIDNFDTVKNYKEIRRIIGYMPERFSLYMDLTVQENLNFFATVFNTTIEENYDLIKDIYQMLEPFKNRKAGDLSGGMKQKLALSCALIHQPKYLLLDEPTTGVDPVSRKDFWEMLQKLQTKGLTTLVSTPFMDDAELCDEVALIQNGEIMSIDSPKNITQKYPHKLWEIITLNNYHTLKILDNFTNKISAFAFGNAIHLACSEKTNKEDIESFLAQNNIKAKSIKIINPRIEDAFMELMT